MPDVLRRLLPSLFVGCAAVALIVLVPLAAGTSWAAVALSLGRVTVPDLVLLAALWLAGLWAHSWVLTAALPGLSRRRALTLNLSGSAVANVLPAGGAAGVGLNFAMVRSWGYARSTFATFTIVSNVADVTAKLAVAVLGFGALILAGQSAQLPGSSVRVVVTALAVALPLLASVLLSARVASAVGRCADRLLALAARAVRSPRRTHLGDGLPVLRRTTVQGLQRAWRQLSVGMAAYLTLQGVLLWTCLHVLGTDLGVTAVLAALAVDRLLTILPLTPGGAGVVEAGTAATLVALGAPPATAAAAVLLYRAFTFAMEIPVGGTVAGLWLLQRRRHRPPAPAPAHGSRLADVPQLTVVAGR